MKALQACLVIALALLPLSSLAQDLKVQTCSRGNVATIQPDAHAFIGGIISLNKPGTGTYGCGVPFGDMQAYEAVRWVLELLNKVNETIGTQMVYDYYVPGIKLGMMVRNYCDRELMAIGSLMDIFPELRNDDASCSDQGNNFTLGVIGGSSSGDALALMDASLPWEIPVVSYEATATQLTVPGKHPNFMRTIPPDGPLAEVIVQVMIRLQWNYIAVVYDSDDYGRQAYNELHARLVANGICLTTGIMIDADNENTANDTLNRILSTNVTGVVYFGPSNYAEALIRAGNGMLPMAGRLQWLLTDMPVDTIFASSSVYQRGIISVTAASRFMVEFEDHWIRIDEANPSPENPWFTGWYEDKYKCKFSPSSTAVKNCIDLYAGLSSRDKEFQKRAEFQQSNYVEAAVMAVYTYAYAMRRAQMTLCPGFSGACPRLQALTRESFNNEYLKKVNFTFTTDERIPSLASKGVLPYNAAKQLIFTPYGDVQNPGYYIYNYNDIETGGGANTFRFRRMGSYVGGYMDFNLANVGMYDTTRQTRLNPLPSSLCPAQGCTPCLGLPSGLKYYFEQGDVIVNGIFSLHQMGITPLTCGAAMSVNQYMYLEAMIYAVNRLNQDNSILNNIQLGGLGLDDCSSSILGEAFLAQIQRGNLQIVDAAGSELNPRKIEAYSAAYTTILTLPLAEAMNMLMKPMVGYRAGGSKLDNKLEYPYYIRAQPGNYDEIKAIVIFLKKMNWNYVQVVTSSSSYYSQDTLEVFQELASKAGICIVATHTIGLTSGDADNVVSGLNANPRTQPTVVLLESQDARRLMLAFNNTARVFAHFTLIGTTMWGNNPEITKDLEFVVDFVFTISIRRSTLNSFYNYLRGLDVNTYTLNPWFKEWYMAAQNCSIGGAGDPCNMTKPITDGVNFKLVYEVESVINAIKAIGRGLDSTLRFYCGPNYNTICTAFLTSQNKGLTFLEYIKDVVFPIEDTAPLINFKFQGQSAAIPFDLYILQNRSYEQVATMESWTDTFTWTRAAITASSVVSSCIAPCTQCLFMYNYLDYWYIPGDLVIGGIFDIHFAGKGPFSCGNFRLKNGALYTEVFNFALQRINSGMASVSLRNVTLGGLAFDGCTNPYRATAIVNRVHTGMDIVDSAGNEFYPSSLISWMSYDSQSTIDTASLVQKLGMPIVSPGATASELDNKNKYYTFFRTIPSDSLVVRGMAEFIQKTGKQYVVVLNDPDTSSRQSRDLFRKYLTSFGICIVANYEFETDGSMDTILKGIGDTQTQLVAVFSEPNGYIKDFLDTKINAGNANPFRYVANRPWGQFTRISRYTTEVGNSVFFDVSSSIIADFKTYLESNQRQVNNSDNPWMPYIYEELFDCDFPGSGSLKQAVSCSFLNPITSIAIWEQDIWTLSTINAIYALAEGVHMTLQQKCGPNYSGVCPSFTSTNNIRDLIMSNMDAENFTDIQNNSFKFIQREANTNYRFMLYSGADSINKGSLDAAGALTLTDEKNVLDLYTNVQSQCPGDCLMCSIQDADLQDFTLIPGDFYIVGLFDVHKPGSTPFTCGDINDKHGLPLLEAFNFALEYVNNKTGIFKNVLPGVLLGGIGLDMCKSPSRAASLVANIHSGNINLVKNGVSVNPKKIDAYVGAMDTESTIRVADILTQLTIPQITYGAMGMDLMKPKYSYFLRSVPADDKQARAMISYLKKFNYNNIQVINSFDEDGEPGIKEFKRLAYINRICIKKEYKVGESGNIAADAPGIINMINQNADAQVVVLWFQDPLPILEAASSSPTNMADRYLFIATAKWGADPSYLTQPSISYLLSKKQLVILDVETADIPDFDKYLEYKTPDNYKSDPWFKDYFEMFQNCYWDIPSAGRTKVCDKSSTIPRADNYKQDSYTLYVINAVFSVAMGLHSAIAKTCNGLAGQVNYYGACNLYITSGERKQKLMAGLLQVNFTDDTRQPFYYTEDRESSRGFHVYNITSLPQTPTVYEYENVGSYNDTHFLKLDITYDTNFIAQCKDNSSNPDKYNCSCPFAPDTPSRYMKKADGDRGLSVVYIGDIHQPSPSNPLACGPINTGIDLMNFLAFFYAIEHVNNNTVFSNSLKLDGLALDSCTHGLRLGQDVYNVLSGNILCGSDNDGLLVSPSTITAFVIDKDHNAIPIASSLSEKKITSISPTAGSVALDNQFIYPYFLRTRGNNLQTAEIILEIARNVSWDYLNIVYTDTYAYSDMANSLLDRSRELNTCVGSALPLPSNASLSDAQQVLRSLSQQAGAKAVVLFVDPGQLKLLMQASQSLGLTGRFIWVVASDWSEVQNQIPGYEQELAGALFVEVRSAILASFVRYVKQLTYKNRGGIPDDWFEDIYQTLHQCNILNLERPMTSRFSRTCTLDEMITDSMIPADPQVLHVIISVYAVAYGLSTIPECIGSSTDLSACLQLLPQRSEKIYRAISSVNFMVPELQGNDMFQFSFDDNGNGEAGYIIRNFKINSDTSQNPYVISQIGKYTSLGLVFNSQQYAGGNLYDRTIPNSNCALGSTCSCLLSGNRMWSYSAVQLLDPANVRVGGTYKDPATGQAVTVEAVPGPGDRFSEGWAIILSILACLGAVISLAIFLYLLIMYPVRGGTTILGFILSFGIILLYLMVFPFIAHADTRICGLRRFALGFVYSIVYSTLMVKLVDCWRLRAKNDPYNIKYSKLGSPFGLFMVTVFFVLVQVMINAEWLILREPAITRIFYKNQYWPRCTPDDFYDESLVLSLVYIMVIIFVSLVIGLATFKTVKNHRESRWILGILTISVVCWVIWCTASILGAIKMRDAAVAVGLLVNATAMLLLMPVRKLYLLQKYNVPDEMMEDEKQSVIAASQRGNDYSSVYGKQYDNNPKLHDAGSTRGSSYLYSSPHESSVAY